MRVMGHSSILCQHLPRAQSAHPILHSISQGWKNSFAGRWRLAANFTVLWINAPLDQLHAGRLKELQGVFSGAVKKENNNSKGKCAVLEVTPAKTASCPAFSSVSIHPSVWLPSAVITCIPPAPSLPPSPVPLRCTAPANSPQAEELSADRLLHPPSASPPAK